MSDQLLGLLRIGLLALLYLFFGRVLWAVWAEVRPPRSVPAGGAATPQQRAAAVSAEAGARTAPRGAVSKLVLLEPRSRKGESFTLDTEVLIGRSSSCRVVLADDTYASQLHARVHRDPEQAWVEDLGSTNGTYLNGNRLTEPHRLATGDRIAVGAAVLEAR
jgi:hypothetical protein